MPIILLSARAGEESRVEGFERGADDYLVKPFSARELLARIGAQLAMSQLRTTVLQREQMLRFEAEKLNEVARSLTAELDLQTLVQKVTDAGTELTAAKFGAFFYNSVNQLGEAFLLYTLSGAPREAFEKFGIPRNTPLFEPIFRGKGVVRIDDVLKDPRYGHNPPHHGMPQGHLAVRSYLAVPVISRFGQVLGGLFFGHSEPAMFTEHAERIALGIAAQAAIAIDNAKFHEQAKKEIAERLRIETALREREEDLRILSEAVPAMVWSCRPDGSLIYLNRRWVDYTGQTLEEYQGYGWARTMHPEDQPRILAQWEQCTRTGEVYEGEVRYRRRDGQYRWHYFRGVPLRDKDNVITAWYGTSIDIQDKKIAEAALHEREERYELVLAGAEAAIWDWDVQAKRVVFSPRWKELRGLSDAEVSDHEAEWISRIHPDDCERVMAAVRNHFERLTPVFAGEYRVRHKDGRWIWLLGRGIARRDTAGRVIRMAGSETDITERKQAEEALAEAMRQKETLYQLVERHQRAKSIEEIYDTALDAILSALGCERVSILLCDDSGVMRFVAWRGLSADYRKATEGHSPWKRDEPNPQPVCIPDVEASALDDSLKSAVTSEGIGGLAFIPLVINDSLAGKFMIYYNTPHIFNDEELDLSLTIAGQLALGIEHIRAEKALRASEERFRTMADNISQLAWTCDLLGNVTWYNQRWLDYTGMTFEEMRDWGWTQCHHPDHVDRVVASVQHSRDTGEPWDNTFPLRGKDGNYRWFLSRAIPIRDATGQIARWFGTNTDITEQREAEEKLHKLTQELEKRVYERTKELQQANAALLRDMEERKKLEEQLLQAQKMESIGVLAGGIAHDFNNILNIIQGYASLLNADGSHNEQTGESLTIINESIQRGSALVQQLLTLARKSTTQQELVNANSTIEGLFPLINQTFPKTIELRSSLEVDLPPIMADKKHVEQALLNLCVNARDAMAGGGRLILKTQSVDGATLQALGAIPETRYVRIEVTDTGMGMNESVQERIFEPFFTTKEMGQGTGLGLSVVYGIVKNHSGLINVESQQGLGTTFRLYFPVAPAIPERETAGPTRNALSDTKAVSNGSATIFLVEDEKDMLNLLEKVFLRRGYRVFTATDGERAVEIFLGHQDMIDVVLLDIGLPKMAGRDVLSRMKQANPDVKIVVVSGYLDPELQSELDRMGVRHFLRKPYLPDTVVTTIQSLLERDTTGSR